MRRIGSIHLFLLAAYLMGVAGTLWDWREHFLGVNNQAPHLVIDVGGLLAIGVLAFTGWAKISRKAIIGFYVLIAAVALITFGPFALMMTARHSQLMASFMQFAMTRGALGLFLPITVLSGWAAWHWRRSAPGGSRPASVSWWWLWPASGICTGTRRIRSRWEPR